MPNIWHLAIWHLAHQTPKQTIMRCIKCQKNLRCATVQSHLWHGTDENDIWFLFLFFSSFSLISNKISLHLHFQSHIHCFTATHFVFFYIVSFLILF